MKYPKLCRNCKWSVTDNTYYGLCCTNPIVNRKDPWLLGSTSKVSGTDCRTERAKYIFCACGIKGKIWEEM